MTQSKTYSLIESLTNVAVGFGVMFAGQLLIFPLFGIHIDIEKNIGIGVAFTGLSISRSYVLRRAFNRINERQPNEV